MGADDCFDVAERKGNERAVVGSVGQVKGLDSAFLEVVFLGGVMDVACLLLSKALYQL